MSLISRLLPLLLFSCVASSFPLSTAALAHSPWIACVLTTSPILDPDPHVQFAVWADSYASGTRMCARLVARGASGLSTYTYPGAQSFMSERELDAWRQFIWPKWVQVPQACLIDFPDGVTIGLSGTDMDYLRDTVCPANAAYASVTVTYPDADAP